MSVFPRIRNSLDSIEVLQRQAAQFKAHHAPMQIPWVKGGYPEPVLQSDEFFYHAWMDQYQNTYINRDIAALFPRLNHIAYRRFLMILCKLSGTILNRSTICR